MPLHLSMCFIGGLVAEGCRVRPPVNHQILKYLSAYGERHSALRLRSRVLESGYLSSSPSATTLLLYDQGLIPWPLMSLFHLHTGAITVLLPHRIKWDEYLAYSKYHRKCGYYSFYVPGTVLVTAMHLIISISTTPFHTPVRVNFSSMTMVLYLEKGRY